MLRSLYDGASTLHVLQRQYETTANNLANINTGGFRRAHLSVVERNDPTARSNRYGNGPQIERYNTDFSQGRLVETGRALDVAISGDAFFTLEDPSGQKFYSKAGRFYRSLNDENVADGTLVTDTGFIVIGSTGAIQIPQNIADHEISIGADGTVNAADNGIGQIQLTSFEDNSTLIPVSQSVFQESARTQQKAPEAQLQQRYFEGSNINVTSELIGLIVGGRLYEAVQKATKTISESLEQSIRA